MKKNKTKSILACAVLASVLGAAAPVWADEVDGPLNISCINENGAAYGVVNGLPGALILAGVEDYTAGGQRAGTTAVSGHFIQEIWAEYLAGDFEAKVIIFDHPNGINSGYSSVTDQQIIGGKIQGGEYTGYSTQNLFVAEFRGSSQMNFIDAVASDVYKITGIGTVPCGRTDSISSLTSSIFNPDGSTLILNNVGKIEVMGKSADSRAVLTMGNGALTYLNFADNGGITMNITDKKPDGQFNYYVAEGRDNSLTVLKNLDSVTINGKTVTVDKKFWKCLETTGGAQIVVVDDNGKVVAADADHWGGAKSKHGEKIGHFYRPIANETQINVQSMTALGFGSDPVIALSASTKNTSATFVSLDGSLRSVNFGSGDACAVSATGGKTATLTDVSSVNVNALDGIANFITVSGGSNITVNGKDNWATVDVKSEKNDANFVYAEDGNNKVNVKGVDAMLYPGAEGKAYVAHVMAGTTTLNLTDSSVSGNLNIALVGIPVVLAEEANGLRRLHADPPLVPVDEALMGQARAVDFFDRFLAEHQRRAGELRVDLEGREEHDAAQGALEAVYVGTAQNSVQNLLGALNTVLEVVQKAMQEVQEVQEEQTLTEQLSSSLASKPDKFDEVLWNVQKAMQDVQQVLDQQSLDAVNDAITAVKNGLAWGLRSNFYQVRLFYRRINSEGEAGIPKGVMQTMYAQLSDIEASLQAALTTVQTGTAQADNVTQKSSYALYQLGYYTPAYVRAEAGATLNLNMDKSLLMAGVNSVENHGIVNLTMKESNWVMQDDSNVDYLKMDDKSEVIFDRDSWKYLTLNVGNYEGNGNFILNTDVGYSGVTSDKLVIDKAEDGSALNLYLLAEDNPLTDPDTKAEVLTLGKDAENLQINLITDNIPDNGLWHYAPEWSKDENNNSTLSFGLKRGDELSTVGRAVTGGVIDTQVWYQESDTVFDRVNNPSVSCAATDSPPDVGHETEEQGSVWASYTHSKNTYDNSIKAITSVANQGGIEKRYNGAVVGYDQCIATYPEHNAALYMGGLIGYGEGRNTWSGGNSELDGKGIGIYAGYKTHKGAYLTALAKYNQYDMDVKGYGYNEVKDDYRLHSFGVSLNAGRRYAKDLNRGFYIEPQAELGYVNYGNDNYELRGIKVEMQATKSCRGRLGLQFGTHNGRADVYGRVSYLKDFQGDSDIMTHYLNGTRDSIKVEQGGHWWNFALGGTFTNGKNLSADMSLNLDRGDHDSKLGFRVGLNWMF